MGDASLPVNFYPVSIFPADNCIDQCSHQDRTVIEYISDSQTYLAVELLFKQYFLIKPQKIFSIKIVFACFLFSIFHIKYICISGNSKPDSVHLISYLHLTYLTGKKL